MAINPGSDLLSDALAAAEPQRAKAAEERLARLAAQDVQDGSDLQPFQDILTSESASLTRSATLAGAPAGGLRPAKRGSPYEQFEVSVLTSLFELMLPQKAVSVFGSGLAGSVWRTMLAQSLGEVAGHAGVAGIARNLEARKHQGKQAAGRASAEQATKS
jgi:hypothetical protein